MLTEREVRAVLGAAVARAGVRVFAAKAKVSQQYVRQVLDGKTPPGPAILKALGIVKLTTYQYNGPKVATPTRQDGAQ